jgi:hypothetical protein
VQKKTASKARRECMGLRNAETAAAETPAPRGRARSPKASQLKEVVEKNVFSNTQEAMARDGIASRASIPNPMGGKCTGGLIATGLTGTTSLIGLIGSMGLISKSEGRESSPRRI